MEKETAKVFEIAEELQGSSDNKDLKYQKFER